MISEKHQITLTLKEENKEEMIKIIESINEVEVVALNKETGECTLEFEDDGKDDLKLVKIMAKIGEKTQEFSFKE